MYRKIEKLEEVLESSKQQPVVIFKHSTVCGISASAKRQMDLFVQKHDTPVYLIVVQEDRAHVLELSERLKVRHETPQAVLVRDGQAQRVFDHFQITKDALERALGL